MKALDVWIPPALMNLLLEIAEIYPLGTIFRANGFGEHQERLTAHKSSDTPNNKWPCIQDVVFYCEIPVLHFHFTYQYQGQKAPFKAQS